MKEDVNMRLAQTIRVRKTVNFRMASIRESQQAQVGVWKHNVKVLLQLLNSLSRGRRSVNSLSAAIDIEFREITHLLYLERQAPHSARKRLPYNSASVTA